MAQNDATSLEVTNKQLTNHCMPTQNSMISTLQENTKQLNERLDKAATVIREVSREVGQMSEMEEA